MKNNFLSISTKRVVIPSLETVQDSEDAKRILPELSGLKEKKGKLKKQTAEDKLMHSILEDDKEKIKEGKLISESISQGIGSITPDIIFENLVKDFELAKKLYGETIIRELSGYSPNYIEKNLSIPEFRKELKKKIEENIDKLKDDELLSKDGTITDEGITLSSLVMYVEELDHLLPKGFGDKKNKKKSFYGDKQDYRLFQKNPYRDIAIRQSIKTALRRGHAELRSDDLKAYERKQEGKITIIYGLDASGSMKGDKLHTAKKAGIALAFKAIQEKNPVGLVVFGSDIKESIYPTLDFISIVRSLTKIRASMETNIAKSIVRATELFPKNDTKHLILLTDALPTKGTIPENDTLQAVSEARSRKITISIVGINLDTKGFELARKITEISDGKLFRVTDLKDIDKLILEDYESLKN